MADNLKKSNAFIPGVRPGAKTKEFLDGVISRVTIIGACFLAVVALTQYWGPNLLGIQRMSIVGGTTLLIVVSVALETMRQIEANILMKQYGS
jgi:preprotein translocase subunit SecY